MSFTGGEITSNAGVLLLRDLDDALGLTEELAAALRDPRDPAYVVHPLVELLRERMFMIVSAGLSPSREIGTPAIPRVKPIGVREPRGPDGGGPRDVPRWMALGGRSRKGASVVGRQATGTPASGAGVSAGPRLVARMATRRGAPRGARGGVRSEGERFPVGAALARGRARCLDALASALARYVEGRCVEGAVETVALAAPLESDVQFVAPPSGSGASGLR